MITSIVAALTALGGILIPFIKPVLIPLITALIGWLMPSPLQKAAQAPGDVQDAEKKLNAGDPSSADRPL